MKKIIVIAILLISAKATDATNSYIWLHGLNDNSYCWSVYSGSFGLYKTQRIEYQSENRNIEDAANESWDDTYSTYRNNMILIGHSMGGLVARELEYNHPGSVRGIITMGTPNQGAPVLNSISNGGIKSIGKKIVGKFTSSVTSTLTAITGIFSVVGQRMADLASPAINKLTTNLIVNKAVMPMANEYLSSQCEKDMMTGSDYMNKISSRQVNVPILSFACEEDRWSIARLGACAGKGDALRTDPNANINGDADKSGYNTLKDGQNLCYIVGGAHTAAAAAYIAFGWWNPWAWYQAGLNGNAAKNWFGTASYLDDGLDFDHAVLVGAYHIETRTDCRKILWWKSCKTNNYTIPEAHDGVVPVNSQLLDKSRGANVIHPSSTIKGVNHMEEFNHPNTKKALQETIEQGVNNPVFRQ